MATPKLISLSILAASALAASAPAVAGYTPAIVVEKTKKVEFRDIDLASPQGQQLLTKRIKQAAKDVCRISRSITPDDVMNRNLCEKRAIARAMPKAQQKIAAYINNRQLALGDVRPVAGN